MTITLDSSAITTFLNCEYLHKYKFIDSIRPRSTFVPIRQLIENGGKEKKSNVKLYGQITQAGTYGHYLLEKYYNSKIPARNQKNISCPDVPRLNNEHKDFIKQRVEIYKLTWEAKKDIVPTNLEVGFTYPLLVTKTREYYLEGRIDFIGHLSTVCGIPIWADHKFQGSKRKLDSESVQFKNYSLVTGYSWGIINYIQLGGKDCTSETFTRDTVTHDKYKMKYWKEELIQIYERYEKILSGKEKLVHRWSYCNGMFGIPCDYKLLCHENNESYRNYFYNHRYDVVEKWSPWQENEDNEE